MEDQKEKIDLSWLDEDPYYSPEAQNAMWRVIENLFRNLKEGENKNGNAVS